MEPGGVNEKSRAVKEWRTQATYDHLSQTAHEQMVAISKEQISAFMSKTKPFSNDFLKNSVFLKKKQIGLAGALAH